MTEGVPRGFGPLDLKRRALDNFRDVLTAPGALAVTRTWVTPVRSECDVEEGWRKVMSRVCVVPAPFKGFGALLHGDNGFESGV